MFRRFSSALAIAVAVSCGDLTPPDARRRLRAAFPVMPLFEGEPAGGGGGGGTGDGQPKTYTQAQVDALTAGLASKNQELLGNVRTLKDQVKPFEGLNADAETIRRALTTHASLEEEKRKAAGDFETWRKDITTKHQQDIDSREQKVAKMTTTLERHLIDGVLATSLASKKGNPKLMTPVLRSQVKVVQLEDGEFAARVVDAKGTPRLKDVQGNFMTIDDLVDEAANNVDYAGAFKAPETSGGGAGGGKDAPAGALGGVGYKETQTEIQIPRDDGSPAYTSLYRRAKEAATKAGKKLAIV